MAELTQRDYWNSRASAKGNYGSPLVLNDEEIDFHKQFFVEGGDTLVLGATPSLCAAAREVCASVISVDYAEDIIAAVALDGVTYEHTDWFEYFDRSPQQFDTIVTDGGLLCLEFPRGWQRIVGQIRSHLKPAGVFSAKVYLSGDEQSRQASNNPSINRFMAMQARAEDNWTVRPTHSDYRQYDVCYAIPPEREIFKIVTNFTLIDTLVPQYEDGERFVSYAWQRS